VNANLVEEGRATKIFAFRGLERVPVDSAEAGEIVAIAGLIKATVSNTIADPSVAAPLHAREIDPPTLAMSFAVNDSPYAGRDGDKVQSRVIRERLEREAEGNLAPPRPVPRRPIRPRGALRDGGHRRRRRVQRHGHRQDGAAQGGDDRHAP